VQGVYAKISKKERQVILMTRFQWARCGRFRLWKIWAVVCVMAAIGGAGSAAAAELSEAAELMPPQTLVLLEVENLAQSRAAFKQTYLYKLWTDPAMSQFAAHFKDQLEQKLNNSDDELVKTIAKMGTLPEGKVGLGVFLSEPGDRPLRPEILAFAEWGSALSKAKEAVAKIEENLAEGGTTVRKEEYRGVEITSCETEPATRLCYCFVGDCLIISTQRKVLEFAVAQLQGSDSPALADDPDYVAAMQRVKVEGAGRIKFFCNIKQVIEEAIRRDETGQAKTALANLGLDNVTYMASCVVLQDDEGFPHSRVFVKVQGEKKGICKMLEFGSEPFRTPRFVSRDVYSLSYVNIDFKKLYQELYRVVYAFSTKAAALMQMPLLPPSPDGQPGLTLKSDIIDMLGSQLIFAQRVDRQFLENPPAEQLVGEGPETLMAIAVANPSALEQSLARLHAAFTEGQADSRRELLGQTIYILDLMKMIPMFAPRATTPMRQHRRPGRYQQPAPGQVPVGAVPKLAFTVTRTHLIMGLEAVVERAIRTLNGPSSGSLEARQWFGKAQTAVPSDVGLAGFENARISGQLAWLLFRQMGKFPTLPSKDGGAVVPAPTGPMQPFMFWAGVMELFDFKLLPEYETVRKYFDFCSVSWGRSTADGFELELRCVRLD